MNCPVCGKPLRETTEIERKVQKKLGFKPQKFVTHSHKAVSE